MYLLVSHGQAPPSHVGSEATHTADSSGANGLKGDFGSSGKLGKAVPDRILGSVSPGREVGTIRVTAQCKHVVARRH